MKLTHYLTVRTPLDGSVSRERKFFVQRLVGEEGFCMDFSYVLDVFSHERVKADEMKRMAGESITVDVAFRDVHGNPCHRFISAMVYRIAEIGMSRALQKPDMWRYRIELSSFLNKLEGFGECRIFQKNNNTSLSIVTELLLEYGFRDFRTDVHKTLPFRPFTVMYNESPLNFIRRLLHDDGIVWFFEHNEKRHTLVLTDDTRNLPEIPSTHMTSVDAVRLFHKRGRHHPVRSCTIASYDWHTPPVKQVRKATGADKGKLESYEYIPVFKSRAEGEENVARRAARLQSHVSAYRGESTIRALTVGKTFTLRAPRLPDLTDTRYLITGNTIEADQETFQNRFKAIPAKDTFCPFDGEPIRRPRIMGPQSAIVVGEGGPGKVQTDSLGRVKVRFHWDHHSPRDANHTSAFLRVAMPGAGLHKGFIFVPRTGEEVIVNFEDGNPDKPVIVGSVYSRHNPPPGDPTEKPFVSIIKNAVEKDANQLIFEDKPGDENLEFTAKGDMSIDVGKDCSIRVVNTINISARAIYIVTRDRVNIVAGKNIDNVSLATIINLALISHTNTAGKNMMDLALGMIMNKAGGLTTQTAGALIANTSALGIRQASENLINNISGVLLLNTAPALVNMAEKELTTTSGLAIINSGSESIVYESEKRSDKIKLISMTEATKTGIKGKTTIGP